jgi:hypothetical protein
VAEVETSPPAAGEPRKGKAASAQTGRGTA